MWPLAELDHGLVEVIFSANGSRTSLLSARVRRQAHYSSILPLQASGIICHNWVWHDRTTECIKILLASPASSLAPACLQAAVMMDTSKVLTSCTKDTQCQWPKQVLLSPGLLTTFWQLSKPLLAVAQRVARMPPLLLPGSVLGHCHVSVLQHCLNLQVWNDGICNLSCVDRNKVIVWKLKVQKYPGALSAMSALKVCAWNGYIPWHITVCHMQSHQKWKLYWCVHIAHHFLLYVSACGVLVCVYIHVAAHM